MSTKPEESSMSRREALKLAGAVGVVGLTQACTPSASAADTPPREAKASPAGAFVYTELQISVPFAKAPWRERNPVMRALPGFINKTWLSGVETNSLGGFYAFDTIEHAQTFVTESVTNTARKLRVAQMSRVFDAAATADASRDMKSVHYGAKLERAPGAFVYTEVAQLPLVPFAQRPWRETNPILKKQPGLLAKTWLSGVGTSTAGGLYAFDTIENAQAFALDYFPSVAARLKTAFCTRVFDGAIVAEASRDVGSPFYA
jgi:hypothetical protein